MTLFLSAGSVESVQNTVPIGIGLIDVGINLTNLLERANGQNIERIIYLASAGAYSKSVKTFSLYISNTASQLDISALKNDSYSPIKQALENITSIDTIDITLKGAINCKVNSSNYICKNSLDAKLFLQSGHEIENMEFYSILKVANLYKVPAVGIFCISNHCDENARESFWQNHKKVLQILNELRFAMERS